MCSCLVLAGFVIRSHQLTWQPQQHSQQHPQIFSIFFSFSSIQLIFQSFQLLAFQDFQAYETMASPQYLYLSIPALYKNHSKLGNWPRNPLGWFIASRSTTLHPESFTPLVGSPSSTISSLPPSSRALDMIHIEPDIVWLSSRGDKAKDLALPHPSSYMTCGNCGAQLEVTYCVS